MAQLCALTVSLLQECGWWAAVLSLFPFCTQRDHSSQAGARCWRLTEGRLPCGLVSRYGMGIKGSTISTQAGRHSDSAMGQRALKYVDRLLRHMTRTFHHQPYPCGHRPHDAAASPWRCVLAVRGYLSRRWGILAAMFEAHVALW
jgi:hypothetical protein